MADKRTLITKAAIKEGMLDLLSQTAFNFITVSSLCRVAGVGRATFYTHYTGLTDVIDELSDDAVDAAKRGGGEGLSSLSQLAEKMRQTTDPTLLAPYMDLLPVCQCVADNPRYHVLFTDAFLSEYILMRIYRQEREENIRYLTANYNISEPLADRLFLFLITGAFEVNRSMNWKKNEAWYHTQKVLLTFMEGGFDALKNCKKNM